jgi:hypothetical protein
MFLRIQHHSLKIKTKINSTLVFNALKEDKFNIRKFINTELSDLERDLLREEVKI